MLNNLKHSCLCLKKNLLDLFSSKECLISSNIIFDNLHLVFLLGAFVLCIYQILILNSMQVL